MALYGRTATSTIRERGDVSSCIRWRKCSGSSPGLILLISFSIKAGMTARRRNANNRNRITVRATKEQTQQHRHKNAAFDEEIQRVFEQG